MFHCNITSKIFVSIVSKFLSHLALHTFCVVFHIRVTYDKANNFMQLLNQIENKLIVIVQRNYLEIKHELNYLDQFFHDIYSIGCTN